MSGAPPPVEQPAPQVTEKRDRAGRYIGIALVAVGVVIVVAAVAVAFNAFYTYKLPALAESSLDELISGLLSVLVELAVRLGFLGLAIWGGGVLVKHGVALLK